MPRKIYSSYFTAKKDSSDNDDKVKEKMNNKVHVRINELLYDDLKTLQLIIEDETNRTMTFNRIINAVIRSYISSVNDESDIDEIVGLIKSTL